MTTCANMSVSLAINKFVPKQSNLILVRCGKQDTNVWLWEHRTVANPTLSKDNTFLRLSFRLYERLHIPSKPILIFEVVSLLLSLIVKIVPQQINWRLVSKIKIKNEDSVWLGVALEPLYKQLRSATKTHLIYTQYRKTRLIWIVTIIWHLDGSGTRFHSNFPVFCTVAFVDTLL